MNCRDCAGVVDHCHGTLIVHASSSVECTDEDCVELQSVRHSFVVDCHVVAGACTCSEAISPARLAS